jgi:glycosyltransferase involved in cell wall biosynthesis
MKLDKPLVTIIIPAYNLESLVGRAIESAVNQTYHNLEILVVDDGSTDGTGALCDEWAKKDARVRVRHISNSGVNHVRKLGLDQAQGEYIRFLDADDELTPDSTRQIMEAFEKNSVDAVISGFDFIEQGAPQNIRRVVPEARICSAYSVAMQWFAPNRKDLEQNLPVSWLEKTFWTYCWKKEILRQNFDRDLDVHPYDDWSIPLLYVLNSKNIAYLPIVGYLYEAALPSASTTKVCPDSYEVSCIEQIDIYSQYSKNESDMKIFLQDFYPFLVLETEKLCIYSDFFGEQETLGRIRKILEHPLVCKAAFLAKNKNKDFISNFYIRHKLSYLLYLHFRHKNRDQVWLAEHNMAVRSIYRSKTQRLQDSWQRKVSQKMLAIRYILIYGAGVYGQRMVKTLKLCGLSANGFVISGVSSEESVIDGLPVYSIDSLPFPKKETVIIVALSDKYREEVVPLLKKQGWRFYG